MKPLPAFVIHPTAPGPSSVDVDDCPELARRYRVAGVPSLLFFRNGQIVAWRIGELSERDLEDWIESLLAGD